MADGQLVATLANDLPFPTLHSEIGLPFYRLIMLTLPDGKAVLCSYKFHEDHRLELAYPHTTSCHRGSGQIVYLQRPAP